jgi:hypothetical protein
MLELAVAHLFKDLGITGAIELEGFAAMWAFDFLHRVPPVRLRFMD